jgi:hypothetical protein
MYVQDVEPPRTMTVWDRQFDEYMTEKFEQVYGHTADMNYVSHESEGRNIGGGDHGICILLALHRAAVKNSTLHTEFLAVEELDNEHKHMVDNYLLLNVVPWLSYLLAPGEQLWTEEKKMETKSMQTSFGNSAWVAPQAPDVPPSIEKLQEFANEAKAILATLSNVEKQRLLEEAAELEDEIGSKQVAKEETRLEQEVPTLVSDAAVRLLRFLDNPFEQRLTFPDGSMLERRRGHVQISPPTPRNTQLLQQLQPRFARHR